jgi:tetratricopeptide (TPR) repeat protein
MRGTALAALGRSREAEALADAVLAKKPDQFGAQRVRALASMFAGAMPEAIQRLDASVDKGDAGAFNLAAWLRLVAETELPRALEIAKRAVGKDPAKADRSLLDTLAAIQAETGDLRGAMETLWPAMEGREMRDGDWYIIGRIAEQIGLRDDAIAAYRRVAPTNVVGIAQSITTHTLAKRRLARMGVK